MPIGTMLALVQRVDTKFGQIDAALDTKLEPPVDAGTFSPTLIDLSEGQREYDTYTQTGTINFALDPAKTPVMGGAALVNIRGGGFAVMFPGNFVALGGITSGTTLTNGTNYPFVFRHAPDWEQISPGVYEDRVVVSTPEPRAPTAVRTSAYQVIARDVVRTDTSGGGFTVIAPTSPTDGAEFVLEDAAEGGSWSVANPLLLVTSDGSTLAGNNGAAGVNHDGGSVAVWRYNAATTDWAFVGEAGGTSGAVESSAYLINVQSYGATNGLAGNNATAINAAITAANALSAHRPTLWFPPSQDGAYLITGALTTLARNVNVRMDPGSDLAYGGAATGTVWQIGNNAGINEGVDLTLRMYVINPDFTSGTHIGLKIINPVSSRIEIAKCKDFPTNVQISAESSGNGAHYVAFNNIYLGDLLNAFVGLDLVADGSNGELCWMNKNDFWGGLLGGNTPTGAPRSCIRMRRINSAHTIGWNNFWGTHVAMAADGGQPHYGWQLGTGGDPTIGPVLAYGVYAETLTLAINYGQNRHEFHLVHGFDAAPRTVADGGGGAPASIVRSGAHAGIEDLGGITLSNVVLSNGGTSVTAAGDWQPTSAEYGEVVEFGQALGAQRILLPAASGFDRGFRFDVLGLADDALFTGFPLIIEAASADMRSQSGFAGWDATQARLQLGAANSLYASATITRVGAVAAERWLVTGDFDKEISLQAGSLQSLRSEWRVNNLVGAGGTVTAVGSDCSQLDGYAGSAQLSLTEATKRPAIAGTPGGTDYRLVFDGANQEKLSGAYTGGPTDDYAFGILFKCGTAYGDAGDTILHTGIANPRHLRLRVEGTPPSSLLSVHHVGDGTVFNKVGADIAGMRDGTWKALVITHLGTTINVFHTGTGERQTKTDAQYGQGHVAADSMRLGDIDSTAGTFEVKFLAWWGKAPDAREAVGWMRWALGNAT